IVGEQTLSRLSTLASEEIQGIIGSLGESERTVSAKRKQVQEVMDTVQREIVRRYTSGEADPASAI
ncbi:MAG: aerial mycelium formation protein, partial [Actinomycetota bacterium]